MGENRTAKLMELNDLVVKSHKASEKAADCAAELLRSWLRDCLAAAKNAHSKKEFDRAMRVNPLPPSMASSIGNALGYWGSALIWWIDDELRFGEYDFPFAVKAYRSIDHEGAVMILTIPNNPQH